MRVVRPLGHEATIARLWNAARAGRLPHALVFEGRAGIGKFAAARWFAQGLLCAAGPGEPCGTCGPCKRVESGGERGNHPDLFVIDPLLEGEERIKIARIAERPDDPDHVAELCLETFLTLRPVESSWRAVLVREAHRMNTHAQNALLKTLEEPRAGTVLVLETHRPSGLLPTIHSRCIRIVFEPLRHEHCEAVLRAAGLEAEASRTLARQAEGSPGVALAFAQSGGQELRALLVAVACGERTALDVLPEIDEVEGEFAGKTEGARDRSRARAVVEIAQALVRDAWRLAAGAPVDRLAHGDVAGTLVARGGERDLVRRGELLARIRADVDQNLAPAALVERTLLLLGEGSAVTRVR